MSLAHVNNLCYVNGGGFAIIQYITPIDNALQVCRHTGQYIA